MNPHARMLCCLHPALKITEPNIDLTDACWLGVIKGANSDLNHLVEAFPFKSIAEVRYASGREGDECEGANGPTRE